MKKILFVIILMAVAFSLPAIAYAHPGSTNEDGGHYNRSTGEYHWHHGYPEHQHEDRDGDGVYEYCPYNFEDKTDRSPGSSGSSSYSYYIKPAPTLETFVYDPELLPSKPSSKPAPEQKKEKEGAIVPVWVILMLSPLLFFYLLYVRFNKKDLTDTISSLEKRANSLDKELKIEREINLTLEKREKDISEKIKTLQKQHTEECNALKKQCMEAQKQFDQYRDDYVSYWENYQMLLEILCHSVDDLKEGTTLDEPPGNPLPEPRHSADDLQETTILEASPDDPLPEPFIKNVSPHFRIPDEVTFADDWLPIWGKSSAQRPYGEYTVFCCQGSSVFHSDRYCSNNFGYTFHYFAEIGSRTPCKRCCSDWPFPNTLPQWYTSIQYLNKNRWRLE